MQNYPAVDVPMHEHFSAQSIFTEELPIIGQVPMGMLFGLLTFLVFYLPDVA